MNKKHLEYHPEKTQIIFFDLEFYVPKKDRDGRRELKANPYKDGHFLIGGTFSKYFPLLPNNDKRNITKEFWLWEYTNEKEMLSDILQFIDESWKLIHKSNNQAELFYAGIGIQRADIQYLFARSKKYELKSESELFNIFYKGRFLDFENIFIPLFKNKGNMLKTKTTNDIIKKLNIPTERESSIGIWDQYDSKDYNSIKERNNNEVADLLTIYKKFIIYIHFKEVHERYSPKVIEEIHELLKYDDFEFLKNCYKEMDDGWFVLKTNLDDRQKKILCTIENKIQKKKVIKLNQKEVKE